LLLALLLRHEPLLSEIRGNGTLQFTKFRSITMQKQW